MSLSRRSGKRFEANIWPGFVDAMTALLLVLVFILSIFMIVQFMLRETISSQDVELDELGGQVQSLANALGLEQQRGATLEQQVDQLDEALRTQLSETERQTALIATLTAQREAQQGRIAGFEEQVAGLIAQRNTLTAERDSARSETQLLSARVEEIEQGLAREISQREAAQLALAAARDEIDAGVEAARLSAARREALERMVADLELERDQTSQALSAAQEARLADAAVAQTLRARLQDADAELTAMTLNLEAQRREAEETLTLLAATTAAKEDLDERLLLALSLAETNEAEGAEARAALEAAERTVADLRAELASALAAQRATREEAGSALSQAEERQALLTAARQELTAERAISTQSQRQVEVLNQQVAALRTQLDSLQALLDESGARDIAADVQIQALGSQLNAALAQVASEQRKVAEEQRKRAEEQERIAQLEAAERARLEEEAKELENYRSEFFGQLRSLLGDQDGVRIEGDRFVFSSEVLFEPGAADLSPEGQTEIAKVANILSSVAGDIPSDLDWVIRVDGHTDNVPLGGRGRYRDNWELSQARALSVVRYMSGQLGIPPNRLAANGFGEFQPVNPANTPAARAQNRRIELKLTEK